MGSPSPEIGSRTQINLCNFCRSRVSWAFFGVLSRNWFFISINSSLFGQVFDEVPERNLNIWTMMIFGYAQSCCPDDALELFDEMIAQGFEPNGVVLASVLSACA
ncbi:Pentatricopeptide repeat [Dillenia turbinata]|uniref:Pentatricopeptide repeat n=1 Tax=Dillenia turbinata TaxID=194707 RepID=A0AAN8W4Y0_9MAGN